MPKVTITIADTPEGGISVESDYAITVGARCSLAQSAALDIIARTRKSFGLDKPSEKSGPIDGSDK